jgi:hypothetical protein
LIKHLFFDEAYNFGKNFSNNIAEEENETHYQYHPENIDKLEKKNCRLVKPTASTLFCWVR